MSREKSNRVKDLCEFFWEVEQKYNLFEYEIDGVVIWEYIRVQLYYALALKTGVLSEQSKRTSRFDRIKRLLNGIFRLATALFSKIGSYDIIVFSHPRSVSVDGQLIDIYSYFQIENLKKNFRVAEFQNDYKGSYIRKKSNDVYRLESINKKVAIKYFFYRRRPEIGNSEMSIISSLEQEILEKFSVSFPLHNFIRKKVKLFRLYYNEYLKIFKRVRPKKIYVVVGYYLAPILAAAHDLDIETIELQHGVITKYHLGYSYPKLNTELNYFPTKIVVWNTHWKESVNYPIRENNVIVDGFQYLELMKSRFQNIEKRSNTYLVLSQAALNEKIAKKILENKDFFLGKEIIYKLHPSEFDTYEDNSFLLELQKVLTLQIVKGEIPLYELMAKSEFQVGVFSTALYEGVHFQCKTILLNIDGIEYMDDFIKYYNPKIL